MKSFYMNGYLWHVKYTNPFDDKLVDRTQKLRVATTDPYDLCVYLSQELEGDFLNKVLIHELGHCTMFSFGLLYDIHRMVKPEYWIDAEEWICNFIADYGTYIFNIACNMLGKDILEIIPYEMERFMFNYY